MMNRMKRLHLFGVLAFRVPFALVPASLVSHPSASFLPFESFYALCVSAGDFSSFFFFGCLDCWMDDDVFFFWAEGQNGSNVKSAHLERETFVGKINRQDVAERWTKTLEIPLPDPFCCRFEGGKRNISHKAHLSQSGTSKRYQSSFYFPISKWKFSSVNADCVFLFA